MPPIKRHLAGADPNTLEVSRKSAKIGTSTRAHRRDEVTVEESKPTSRRHSARIQTMRTPAAEEPRSSLPKSRAVSRQQVDSDSGDVSTPTRREEIQYSTKDTSKLRRFLVERHLSPSGTRGELITRLECSFIDYTALSSEDLSTMLKHRNITMYAQGRKDIKIQRLRMNDKVDHDTGNGAEGELYGQFWASESILNDVVAKRDEHLKEMSEAYAKLSHRKLLALLEKRKLSSHGNKETLTKRLLTDDCETLSKHIRDLLNRRDATKAKLELHIGHPVSMAGSVKEEEDEQHALDNEAREQGRRSSVSLCDYDWRDSHWADRTERDLTEITRRRGMPGGGPKTAMLKWLDTGKIDYEYMYGTPLRIVCMERGIHAKSDAKKADLVRILREDDARKKAK
ncbi:hypothetical protein B7494_g6121 [Chlorociboria aeruginascens]|nr:hypothetical protein B7494_g6121 [Chlorociboria aeruginascens]